MQSVEYPKFITTCEEDEDGNLVLPFPEELLEALGWHQGTALDFDIVGDRLVIREVVCSSNDQTGRVTGGE